MNELIHPSHATPCRTANWLLVLGCLIALMCAGANAQQSDDDEAPPPIKQISKEEKKGLSEQTTAKAHTELSLDLMNKRIEKAELLNSKGQFEDMFKELGGFNALMDESLAFLASQDKDRNKVLYNFKRLDIGLRAFMPRLQTIRRDLPSKYDPYVKRLVKFISEAREKALEPMFGNSVVPDRPDH